MGAKTCAGEMFFVRGAATGIARKTKKKKNGAKTGAESATARRQKGKAGANPLDRDRREKKVLRSIYLARGTMRKGNALSGGLLLLPPIPRLLGKWVEWERVVGARKNVRPYVLCKSRD